MPVRGQCVEGTVEVQVIHEQSFDPGIPVPAAQRLAHSHDAGFMQHFIRLDVNAPGAATGVHRAVRLERERPAAARKVPHRVEHTNPRIADRDDHVAGLVL